LGGKKNFWGQKNDKIAKSKRMESSRGGGKSKKNEVPRRRQSFRNWKGEQGEKNKKRNLFQTKIGSKKRPASSQHDKGKTEGGKENRKGAPANKARRYSRGRGHLAPKKAGGGNRQVKANCQTYWGQKRVPGLK